MIDINKKYRTRDGDEVRIYAIDGGHENCMAHGAVKNGSGFWEIASWYTAHGGFYDTPTQHRYDLIEVSPRQKRTLWINAYTEHRTTAHLSRKLADEYCCSRIACIKVELDFEEGEGL